MADYIEFSAKTKNEAITKACIDLGASSDQLDIQVVSEGSTGFFGIGSKPAVIKVRKIETAQSEEDEIKEIVDSVSKESIGDLNRKNAPKRVKDNKKSEKPAKQAKEKPAKQEKEAAASKAEKEKPVKESPVKDHPAKEAVQKVEKDVTEKAEKAEKSVESEKPEKIEKEEKPAKVSKPIEIITDPEEIKDVEQRAVKFLTEVFHSMDLGEVDIVSKYNSEDGSLDVSFEGEDMGVLIGKRGQTLDSLQYLTSLVVNKGKSNYIRVKLDTEDYRRRRKETLENLAKGIAYKVKKTRRPVVLEPMNPYERRIIHSALQDHKYVFTVSEGEEPYRHVVVKPKRY
ncbi:MAG: Jag N-terminal domain-containing protein [Blautia sp.]|nr:Jag N-terminal domain-containing protein [Blautia sp.]